MKILEMIDNPVLLFLIGLLLSIIFRDRGGKQK